ncbi:trypsin-like peptidase domain-containing protein [Streptomyces sp. S.PNR 29]|uniref:trypsin-like serine peptidase n=1 Tax=Streptomyces sp. S.PNR 29 TaxID=2973805 RepID=UPI0025B119D7|nr:trypsin-like peptidase domain-containing protein [Streptomyces sp. S.PNR 29]MDN0194319.1 trypsin-like peptidase domain-containing protein [Streptomyces sp. S.PNR 29]
MTHTRRPTALSVATVLLAFTSASFAAADDGSGPLGVPTTAAATARTARIGALFPADRSTRLAGGHFCTASVVHGPYHNLVVTAAHCLDEAGDLVFVPGYRDGRAPYGVWRVERRFLPQGWAKGQDEDSDVAFAVVEPRSGKGVEDVVGGNRFTAGTATGATAVTVTGYPDSRETPVSCTNRPTAHSSTQQRIDCPGLSGGTSGSPWVNGDGQVVGVLGGHDQGGTTPDVSYSVVLGAEAADLYREAAADP